MPRRMENPEHKYTLYPIDPPPDMDNWAEWQTVCVPVPVPLIQYIPMILAPYRWKGRINGTDEQKTLFSEIWEDLITRFINANYCGETGAAMILRQNPANKCQLQQSVDNGETWTLAFDYSLCRSRANDTILIQNLTQIFQGWHGITDPQDINPNAPNETFNSATGDSPERLEARKLALCEACRQYVYTYCEIIREINRDATTAANIGNLAIAAVVALGTAGAIFSFGTSTLLAMGIAAAIGGLGLASYSALTDAVLDDDDAKNAVICLMYAGLRDQDINAENFAAAFEGATLTGNAELIRVTITVDISNETGLENQFNAFTNILGDALRPAELGLVDDCPCMEDCDITYNYGNPLPIDLAAGNSATLDPTGYYSSGAFAGHGNLNWIIGTSDTPIDNMTSLTLHVQGLLKNPLAYNTQVNLLDEFDNSYFYDFGDGVDVTEDGDETYFYCPLPSGVNIREWSINMNHPPADVFKLLDIVVTWECL